MKRSGGARQGIKWASALRDGSITLAILLVTTGTCLLLRAFDDGDTYVSMLFLLAVLLVARFTNGYLYGIAASVMGVFCVNYVFTYPYMALNFTISGYPVTFISMAAVAIITSAMTSRVKEQERVRAAAERERMRGNLLRAISHDLRTPLTSILGASSALLENESQLDAPRRRELVSEIREDANWLIRMVENLLSITRIGDAVKRIRKQPEAAEEVMGAALSKFAKRYPSQAVDVRVPQELLMVPMDALLVEQVLINLLDNAVRHGKTATLVELSAHKQGDEAVFIVRDNGQGIPKEAMEHLFEGYLARMDSNNTDSTRGMGIGLSVCMSIIQAHGGQMRAENNQTGGATFAFTLPLEETAHEQQQ